MPDLALLAGNPYLQALQQTPEDKTARLWSMLANTLTGLGAGIAGGGAAGQSWSTGIAPGFAMGAQMNAQQQQRDETAAERRFNLGLHMATLQDKQDERTRARDGLAAWATANDPSKAAAAPGMNVQPPTPLMGPGAGPAAPDRAGFVQAMMPHALEVSKATGLDPRLVIAQSALETGYGASAPGNNYFGVKSHGRPGGQMLPTTEAGPEGIVPSQDSFRTYQDPSSSARDYADFLKTNSRYAPVLQAQGLDAQIDAMGKSGYATDPNYAAKLRQIAQGLPQIDAQAGPVVQGGGEGPTPVQYRQPQTQTPPPAMEPPPEPPQVPRPALPSESAAYLSGLAKMPGMTVEKLEAEKQRITHELWTKQQGAADKKWQQQWDTYKFNRGESAKLDTWSILTPQEVQERMPGARPNMQWQQNRRTGEIKPVDGGRQGDISSFYTDPDVQKKIAAMAPADRAAFNAATSMGDHKAANTILTKSQTGLSEEQQALSGPELLNTLPFGDKEIVEGLTTGRLLPADLSKRAGGGTEYNRLIALASKVDKDYSPSEGGARRAFETGYMGKGQGAQTVLAVNTASQHMEAYSKLADALHNGDAPAVNAILNGIKKQFGDANVPTANSARILLGTEVAKAVRGAGSLNESEEKAAQAMVDPNASPAQQQAALVMLKDFMMGRMHPIEDMAKARGIPDRTVNNYMSPRARDAFDYIDKNPIGGNKAATPNRMRPSLDTIFGNGPSVPGGNRPDLGSILRP